MTDPDEIVADRMECYGHPADNHARTAELWNAFLKSKAKYDRPGRMLGLDAEDVCLLNILQKIAREMHRPEKFHRDNVDDIIGFAKNLLILRGKEPR